VILKKSNARRLQLLSKFEDFCHERRKKIKMYTITLLAIGTMVRLGMANSLAKEQYAPDTLPYEHPGSMFRQIHANPTCGGEVLHDGSSTGTYKDFSGSKFVLATCRHNYLKAGREDELMFKQ
jgi:hypothetical protein